MRIVIATDAPATAIAAVSETYGTPTSKGK